MTFTRASDLGRLERIGDVGGRMWMPWVRSKKDGDLMDEYARLANRPEWAITCRVGTNSWFEGRAYLVHGFMGSLWWENIRSRK